MNKEPAGTIGGSISLVLAAAFAILKASGVQVTEDMTGAIEAFVWALCAVPFVSALLTRFFVVSPQTAADAVVTAKKDMSGTNEVPAINVVGDGYANAVRKMEYVPTPPPVN